MSRENLIRDFVNNIDEWRGANIKMIAGDASFRKYYRITKDGRSNIIMDAPPDYEDVKPFIKIAEFLIKHNFSAPKILATDINNGLLLLEDFGDDRYTQILNGNLKDNENSPSEHELYNSAIDALIDLHKISVSNETTQYDEVILTREIELFSSWYLPLIGINDETAKQEYKDIWIKLLPHCHSEQKVLVLRDYHADNLMWLPKREGIKKVGLLDFQDALIGSPAYDLMSLLEDARRDVDKKLADEMIEYYIQKSGINREEFINSYHILAAQRNCKILGIFARLYVRDGKENYLSFLPRVWNYLEQDLEHPYLEELKIFFNKYVGKDVRTTMPNFRNETGADCA